MLKNSCSLRVRLLFALAIVGLAGNLRADQIDVLFPAYANPASSGGPAMWDALVDAGNDASRGYGLNIIFNPASGPGTAVEPNYVTGTGTGALERFYATGGGTVYGYVPTGYGTRNSADVIADANQYLSGFYAGLVDGIFLDEVSNDLSHFAYYQNLAAQLPSHRPTIANLGLSNLDNGTGAATPEAFKALFDTYVTFEQTGANYSSYQSNSFAGEDPASIAHLIHTQASWDASLLAEVSANGAGMLYVTDDVMNNPFDQLPSYWSSFSGDLKSFNAVPEPGCMAAVALGLSGVLFRRSRNATRRS